MGSGVEVGRLDALGLESGGDYLSIFDQRGNFSTVSREDDWRALLGSAIGTNELVVPRVHCSQEPSVYGHSGGDPYLLECRNLDGFLKWDSAAPRSAPVQEE